VHSTPQERGTLNLAYCGTVAAHKGVHVILEALRTADLPSVDLLIIGQVPSRDYQRELRERAEAIPGLKLRMYGAYERTELSYLLRDVDCVIVPSLVPEAGPIVPREALALGIPVLVARLGALPELVTDGENGFTFDPNRPGELAGILRRVARDEGLFSRLREGARRTPVVTVSEHAAAIRLVYQEAMEAMTRNATARSKDGTEMRFLHKALLDLGVSGAA
jgi:glycosyltransferase involved in cell wall biosynthesis